MSPAITLGLTFGAVASAVLGVVLDRLRPAQRHPGADSEAGRRVDARGRARTRQEVAAFQRPESVGRRGHRPAGSSRLGSASAST